MKNEVEEMEEKILNFAKKIGKGILLGGAGILALSTGIGAIAFLADKDYPLE